MKVLFCLSESITFFIFNLGVTVNYRDQAGKLIKSIESVLEQDEKTELVIEQVVSKVEPMEVDQQVDGQPAVLAKKDTEDEKLIELKEPIADGTEDVIEEAIAHCEEVEDVAERMKRVLQFLETTKKIHELSNKGLEECKEQACAALEEPKEEIKAKKRILEMCLETAETFKLFEETEKTLDLLEESDKILSKLQQNLKTLQREKMSTRDNLEIVSRVMEMTINTSASEFEQLNVDDNVQVQSEPASGHESSDQMTTTPHSDPPVCENSPDSEPNFLERITDSMRERYDACCFVLGCSLCVLCFVICRNA